MHRLPVGKAATKYSAYAIAARACTDSPDCGGVYKEGGNGAFFLCDRHPPMVSPADGQVWSKPPGVTSTTSSTGVRVVNSVPVWCSNWCCCTPGWHGDRCDDTDECVSTPCLNGGTCRDSSSTYLVNDYFRKYRCACSKDFHGHNCDTKAVSSATESCAIQLGAKSASGSTSSRIAYKQFQTALMFMGITLKSSNTNFERMCKDVYTHHERGGVCGQQFVLYNMAGKPIATPVVNCTREGKALPEALAVLSLCSMPCMLDPTSKCCFLPSEVAYKFPCCRELGCCPDQRGHPGGHKRRVLGQQPRKKLDEEEPSRALPAVSVSVSVEETSSSQGVFKSLMTCLRSGKTDCYSGQSPPTASPTAIPARNPPASALGRRQLQVGAAVCKNNGKSVTCNDGVQNGHEVMTDCGGDCVGDQGKCVDAARKVVHALSQHAQAASAGLFAITMPRNITMPDCGVRCDDSSCVCATAGDLPPSLPNDLPPS